MDVTKLPLTSSHWGTYRVESSDGQVTRLHGFENDPDPSPIGQGIVDVLDGPTRITSPMVRRSWLENKPGTANHLRGADEFVAVSWDVAEQLVADELQRVRSRYGNASIYAGSYGWANAGRFHHAQSQLKRFLNCIGGFTGSVNSYSFAAGEVIVPHVLGSDVREFAFNGPAWQTIAESTDLVVAFGGIPLKNGQISQGGGGKHVQRLGLETALAVGVNFVDISPIRNDGLTSLANAQGRRDRPGVVWFAPRPSTDTALILGLAHTLVVEGLHDLEFVDSYTTGFQPFAEYLLGSVDGVAKSAAWAAEITGLAETQIQDLARRMASVRTLISTSWSLTRQQHGEQTYWAAISLAALLGQIGLPGGGIAFGLSAVNTVGHRRTRIPVQALPQGVNQVDSFIPVARVSDMLLNPGAPFEYNGTTYTYPEAKVVYWAGGNPFHHHQDLNRMLEAWRMPDTIIVNEWCWNAMAKHADIVLPCTTTLERSDLALTPNDGMVAVMDKVIEPKGLARNDHQIFRGIAARMGAEAEFTEGKSEAEWIEWIYEETRTDSAKRGIELPPLRDLEQRKYFQIPDPPSDSEVLATFRSDPGKTPLGTPSGRIELYSETIASFGYEDCLGHAAWFEPTEWLGASDVGSRLHIITDQPANKLHSQLDHGSHSRASKIDGREPVTIHPDDAQTRGIAHHDVVRIFNDRGACYAAAVLDDRVRQGVLQMATGAWFDPDEPGVIGSPCKHGNPNVFTADIPTSQLAQGCSAHTCLVSIEPVECEAPAVTAFEPPSIIEDS